MNVTPNRWLVSLQQGATLLFLVYVLYLLGRSAWVNAESNRKVANLRAEITRLAAENDRLRYLIVYQQTESFQELEARQKLGLKKPGELVIVLPEEPAPAALTKAGESTSVKADPMIVMTAWWQYFFG